MCSESSLNAGFVANVTIKLGMEGSFATVLSKNKTALALNKCLGYECLGEQESETARIVLLRDTYFEKSASLRHFLKSFARQSV